jgi:hypothetical protein
VFNSVLYAADPRRALAGIARVTAPAGRAVVTVGAGPEQAESAALINPLAPYGQVPGDGTLDLASLGLVFRCHLAQRAPAACR